MQPRILILPGWQDSGPTHWQSLWEQQNGFERVVQHDWERPRRGDWIARLEEVLLDKPDQSTILVAHSLGCLLVAAWAAHTRKPHLVQAAFLVAPADTQSPLVRGDFLRSVLPGWGHIPTQPLPWPSSLVASRDDPYCTLERARSFAQAWGSHFIDAGAQGHLNAQSGLGTWPQGQAWLAQLLQRSQVGMCSLEPVCE